MRNSFTCAGLVLVLSLARVCFAQLPIDHWTTTNGAEVYYVYAPEIPMLDIRVVFAAGSVRDGTAAGLAGLTSALLTEGAGTLDADAFHEQLAATGAGIGSGSMRDMAWVSFRSLTDAETLTPSLDLLRSVLLTPRFDADALSLVRSQLLVGLKSEDESPDSIAERAFYRAIYRDHPYGAPPEGAVATVSAITREQVQGFYRQYYVARNATIAVVGAIPRADCERLIATLVEKLPAGDPAPALPAVPTLATAQTLHVDFPSAQSHVWLGQAGMKRGDADYFPLLVGNHVLGGNGTVSTLFTEIREKRSLSYSVSSTFLPMADLGPFIATLQTKREQEAQAVQVLRETLAKFLEDGPDPAALVAAKQNLIGGFPLRIDSNAKIVEYLATIGFYRLPLDYLETFTQQVDQVSVEQVKDAFKRRLDLNRMVQVTVGPARAAQAH